jgi:phosphoglycolate phosphatase
VDSRADIAASLGAALARHGYEQIGEERVSAFVGDGARMLVARALTAVGASPDDTDAVLATYLDEYRERHLENTRLYPGVVETLEVLRIRLVRLAVVTNKPHEFSVSLLEHLGVGGYLAAVIGGDSTPARKPSAGPLLAAMAACGAGAVETAMVGDGEADMRAGAAAGALTIGVTYGFRTADELAAAGAQSLIHAMRELPAALGLA